MLLRSLARNESTISANNVLIKDIDENVTEEDVTISSMSFVGWGFP